MISPEDLELTRVFLRMLAAEGVRSYVGPLPCWSRDVKIELGEAPTTAPPAGQPHANGTALVDAGGGVMVDPDLFSHEAE